MTPNSDNGASRFTPTISNQSPGSHADDGPSALPPGTKLDHYTIEHVLGTGRFGTTYFARESLTERPVAIKELLPRACPMREGDDSMVHPAGAGAGAAPNFAGALLQFHAEAKIAAGFHHPNIPEVLAYFEANGTGYLVMVFHEGTTLAALLEPDRVLGEGEMLAIVRPLLAGVEEVHRRGFLHRDITPENILVRPNAAPLLLDFGAAFQPSANDGAWPAAVLAQGYASPEQYDEPGSEGPWTDVYALGAVMFRCLLGRPPIDAARRASSSRMQQPDPLGPELAWLRERASADVAFAIEAALRIRAPERPQSALRLRDLLAGGMPALALAEPLPLTPTDEPVATLLLGRKGRQRPVPAVAHANGWRPRVLHSTAVGAVVALVLAGGLYVAHSNRWPARFHNAERASVAPAKPAPKQAIAAPKMQAAEPTGAPWAAMRQGFADYQRLMLDSIATEAPPAAERASPVPPSPPASRPGRESPPQAQPAAPPSRSPANLNWQSPGYTAR